MMGKERRESKPQLDLNKANEKKEKIPQAPLLRLWKEEG